VEPILSGPSLEWLPACNSKIFIALAKSLLNVPLWGGHLSDPYSSHYFHAESTVATRLEQLSCLPFLWNIGKLLMFGETAVSCCGVV